MLTECQHCGARAVLSRRYADSPVPERECAICGRTQLTDADRERIAVIAAIEHKIVNTDYRRLPG